MTVTGIIHGKTIELKLDPHLPEGAEVELTIVPKKLPKRPSTEGLKRSAGAVADDPAAESDMAEVLRLRKTDSFRKIPD
ncbi:MAG TPA: hypothetical protein VEK08_14955 [Planctomycetota bacterium]|nr:hypothetical protein [Planctomycetota bacterium]